ncbi:RecQ family zinc-binding domain-containing protein, partial [Vibrio sinaloensis]
EGVIRSKYSYFADYRFKFLLDKQRIIDHFDPERRQFIQALFNCSPQARTWCQVDFDTLWHQFQGDRARAIAALDYFNEKGWIELESKLMTEVYHVEKAPNISAVVSKLATLFHEKESSDISRIHHLIDFFQSELCLSSRLAHYFGDQAAPTQCGHCSVCRGEIAVLPKCPQPDSNKHLIDGWLTQLEEKARRALTSQLKTKFLCGIATPFFTKIKARTLPGYGQYESTPFKEVKQWVEQTR